MDFVLLDIEARPTETQEITLERANILGVGISAIDMEQGIAMIDGWIKDHNPNYVCVSNVHTVMECQRDTGLKQVFANAGLVTPDGMPLVWLSHLSGFKNVRRVYGPDLMLELCRHSAKRGHSHFFYGGKPGVPDELAENLKRQFPDIKIAGTYSPPFRPLTKEEDIEIIEMINRADPDIIWVGMSAPKQEWWMSEHLHLLNAKALIGVGAAFDFHSGRVRQSPGWMQAIGMEWFFRFLMEPRRLWKRYAWSNPAFVALVMLQLLGIKRYGL